MGFDDEREQRWFDAAMETEPQKDAGWAKSLSTGLARSRKRWIKAELRPDKGTNPVFNPYKGLVVYDASRVAAQGLADQDLLCSSSRVLRRLVEPSVVSSCRLVSDLKLYILSSCWLQNNRVARGDFANNPENIVEGVVKKVGELRTGLIEAGQRGLVTRVDNALLVRREIERQQRDQRPGW